MDKGGLYNRGSILLSKSKKQVNKNHTYAVGIIGLICLGQGARRDPVAVQGQADEDGGKYE